jgi:hypothetical protein
VRRLSLLLLLLLLPTAASAQVPVTATGASDGVTRVLRQVERALETDDASTFVALLLPGTANTTSTRLFLNDWVVPGVTRAVVRERLRSPVEGQTAGDAALVYVDVLTEFGTNGRVSTWMVDFRRDTSTPDTWRIASVTVLTTITGLYRLSLNPDKEFTVVNLTLSAEDFEVRLPQGVAFVAETGDGTTGIVLLGHGDFTFSPAPASEKGQVKIFSGSETLQRSSPRGRWTGGTSAART